MTTEFFETPAALRKRLRSIKDDELWVGFYKKGAGHKSITWPESVDEALCVGWIDGIRRGVDDHSYMIRFTPRRARSIWSAVNIRRAKELMAEGRMQSAGLAAFEARDEALSRQYSFEQASAELTAEMQKAFRANKPAWTYWQDQPTGYRKTITWWVISAKREDTRQRRLTQLIDECANQRRIEFMRPRKTTR